MTSQLRCETIIVATLGRRGNVAASFHRLNGSLTGERGKWIRCRRFQRDAIKCQSINSESELSHIIGSSSFSIVRPDFINVLVILAFSLYVTAATASSYFIGHAYSLQASCSHSALTSHSLTL